MGSATIVPSLLQAWGCDPASPGGVPGGEAGAADPHQGPVEGPTVLTGTTFDGAVGAGKLVTLINCMPP